MINKYPSYSSIVEWVNKLKDYELDNVWFSVKEKPRVKLKSKDRRLSVRYPREYYEGWNRGLEQYLGNSDNYFNSLIAGTKLFW